MATPIPFEDKELLVQVGRVIRNWTQIETSLAFMLCDLLPINQFHARIIMSSIQSTRVQQDLIRKLGETYIDPKMLRRFRKLMKRVNNLGLERNYYAHAMIGFDSKPKKYMIFRDTFPADKDRTFTFEVMPIHLGRVKSLADALPKLAFDLAIFGADLQGNVYTSPRTHREAPHPDTRKHPRKKSASKKP